MLRAGVLKLQKMACPPSGILVGFRGTSLDHLLEGLLAS